MAKAKLMKVFYGERGLRQMLEKKLEEDEKKREAKKNNGGGDASGVAKIGGKDNDDSDDASMKNTRTLDRMASLLVIQGMLDNLIKTGTNLESVRKDKFKDAVWTLWKTSSGIDGREMKTEITDIASDVGGIKDGIAKLDVKMDLVLSKL
ncbi:hypothetical protein LOK49_LG14G00534 [Camellia lanceoleosa]|uniref:Uncharacterized protein n=1 Tax=Camellia lanceoleosa TaxID=1840588 RepID=A0ACC0FE01_9ERIC|nr:hypothetical protein LOK49_LG14G00534 [Camellia lanceoleosa]